ncbi:MAG: monooxygenase [Acidimicrobiales bacterium]
MSCAGLVTMHLFGVPTRHVGRAVGRMALDRRPLSRTPGLRFFKLLGTGDGRTFTVRDADPHRWGLLAVWADKADVEAFEANSGVVRAWARIADERWRVDLLPTSSRGRWAGQDPFADLLGDDPAPAQPVAALTRARLRWGGMRSFWRAVPPVALAARTAPGLRFALGIGEAPIGLQATFSVWADCRSLDDFAYRGEQHRQVIRATRERRWYSEELFARLEVLDSQGTVGGIDPLAA